jgi:hypothetical protein
VHPLLSALHDELSALAGYEQVPLAGLHVPGSVWHWSGVVQETDAPAVHTPDLQTSFCVHALLSALHDVLSALVAYVQAPVAGAHVPGSVWHWSGVVQETDAPAVHTPDLQTSFCVHALLSALHGVLSAMVGYVQAPVAGAHVPGSVWHWSGVVQETDAPAVHTPDLQTSFCVHALLSALHGVLSALLAYVQVPLAALHMPGSVWH